MHSTRIVTAIAIAIAIVTAVRRPSENEASEASSLPATNESI